MYQVVYISETGFTSYEFYRILARKLSIEVSFRKSDLWHNIKEKLLSLKKQRKILPVIIIDLGASALRKDFGASKLPKSLSPASAV